MAFQNQKLGKLEYLTAESIGADHCFSTRFGGVSKGSLSSLNLGIHRDDEPANVLENFRILGQAVGFAPEELTGRGAGLSDAGLKRKRETIARALETNQPAAKDPLDVLAKVGGFEIAGMVGAFLGGMQHGMPVIMDGVISAVAALTAVRMKPQTRDFILPSHISREPAMARIMDELGMRPILHADMALGEGTGAVALIPLLDMALKVYHGPHTFDDLGMAAYTAQEDPK